MLITYINIFHKLFSKIIKIHSKSSKFPSESDFLNCIFKRSLR